MLYPDTFFHEEDDYSSTIDDFTRKMEWLDDHKDSYLRDLCTFVNIGCRMEFFMEYTEKTDREYIWHFGTLGVGVTIQVHFLHTVGLTLSLMVRHWYRFYIHVRANPIPNGTTLVQTLPTLELTLSRMVKKTFHFTTLLSSLFITQNEKKGVRQFHFDFPINVCNFCPIYFIGWNAMFLN
jgi:hypothetical protein